MFLIERIMSSINLIANSQGVMVSKPYGMVVSASLLSNQASGSIYLCNLATIEAKRKLAKGYPLAR